MNLACMHRVEIQSGTYRVNGGWVLEGGDRELYQLLESLEDIKDSESNAPVWNTKACG